MNKLSRAREWIKNLWDVYDTGSKVLTAMPFIGVAVAATLRAVGDWGQKETSLPNWLLVGGAAFVVGSLAAIVWRLVAAMHARTRTPFNIYETSCEHLWRLKLGISHWIENDLERNAGEMYIDSIIDGPFHSAEGCSEELFAWADARHSGRVVKGHCDRCNRDTRIAGILKDADSHLPLRELKVLLLRELKRRHINGEAIYSNMKFSVKYGS